MTELKLKGNKFVWNHHLAVLFRLLVSDTVKGTGDRLQDACAGYLMENKGILN